MVKSVPNKEKVGFRANNSPSSLAPWDIFLSLRIETNQLAAEKRP